MPLGVTAPWVQFILQTGVGVGAKEGGGKIKELSDEVM